MDKFEIYVVFSSPILVGTMTEEDVNFFYSQITKMPGTLKNCPQKLKNTSSYEGLIVCVNDERFCIYREVVLTESTDKVSRLFIDHLRSLERQLLERFVKKSQTNGQITSYQYDTVIVQDLSHVLCYTDRFGSDFDMRY